MQTMQFLYLGGLVDASADITPEIERRIRLAWACYNRFKLELYDMEDAPFTLKVRMLNKAEVMEILLYGCVIWTPGQEHFAEFRTAHHNLLRIIGFQRRHRTDHPKSYTKALKEAQCESVVTTIR